MELLRELESVSLFGRRVVMATHSGDKVDDILEAAETRDGIKKCLRLWILKECILQMLLLIRYDREIDENEDGSQ